MVKLFLALRSICSILDHMKNKHNTFSKSQTRHPAAAFDYASPDPAHVTAQVRSTLHTKGMMIQDVRVANPEECPSSTSTVGSVPHSVLQLANTNVKSALIAYLTSITLSKDIAREHGFTAGALSYWARKFGLPVRRRGRRPLLQPTSAGRRILELVRAHGIAETARRVGVSKQRVSQIARRWKEYLPVRPLSARTVGKNEREEGPTRKKENRIRVVSFRLSPTEVTLLRQRYPEVKSVCQAARGIVTGVLSIRKQL
jgi:hypothetical protein